MSEQQAGWDPVLNALMAEFAACVPRSWTSASLRVSFSDNRMACVIIDPGGTRQARASNWLISLVDDLHRKMERAGEMWTTAQVSIALLDCDVDAELRISGSQTRWGGSSSKGPALDWRLDLRLNR